MLSPILNLPVVHLPLCYCGAWRSSSASATWHPAPAPADGAGLRYTHGTCPTCAEVQRGVLRRIVAAREIKK